MSDVAKELFNKLRYTYENEVIEFKEAKNDFSFDKIGKYFSALSNEANLLNRDCGYLIFGLEDKKRDIVGTSYRDDKNSLNSLKKEIADHTLNRISFKEIHELFIEEKRVLIFVIPPAPVGMPVNFKGHYYAREGESLTSLNIEKIERIRIQGPSRDWSKQIVEESTIADLDPEALTIAKKKFKERNIRQPFYNQIDSWTDLEFLDKAKVTINGNITRTALLLLGKSESSHYLSPYPAQITWKLDTEERAYTHFSPPFILATTGVLNSIRNIMQKLFPRTELLATEVMKYDSVVILEALHNCIAHQDYTKNGRILVTEKVDKLIFRNEGSFFQGSADDYLLGKKTPTLYRNPWLIQAMVQLDMIDTMGYGIHTMTVEQSKRYFPLPDYTNSAADFVELEIYGHSLDVNYSLMLLEKEYLDLETIILMDKVQKRILIPDDAAKKLRSMNLIEGRKPNYIVSANIASITDSKVDYIKQKGFDDIHYKELILEYLRTYKKASKNELTELLYSKLPDILSDKQKHNKIRYLLNTMSNDLVIVYDGPKKGGFWKLENVRKC